MNFKQKGFTLIELMVVVILMGIMFAIAIPGMNNFIASSRVSSTAEQFANAVRFARTEAARLNRPVYFCPAQIKKDGKADQHCRMTYAGLGVVTWADNNNNRTYEAATDLSLRTVILNNENNKRISYKVENITFSGAAQTNGARAQMFGFLPDGTFMRLMVDASGTPTDSFPASDGYARITFTDKEASDEATRQKRAMMLLISSSGRVEFCPRKEIQLGSATGICSSVDADWLP